MAAAGDGLKQMLRFAVQSVHWTYIIFWKFCPQQRVLVWEDGYYNGAIKTRKTVQSVEVSTEEAALSRSEQLRELYESLASGEQQVTENQRPSGALSPEDLTESEWFYLMCVSFSFPPGVGLVGDAYAKQQHRWLTGANEVDSTVFSRTILAKSAYIQTVICIPLLNGVVELGTTDKVEETNEFIRHVKLFFASGNDNPIFPPPKPTLSAHSSNTTLSSNPIPNTIKPSQNGYSMDEDVDNEEDDDDEVDDDNDQEEDAENDEVEDIGDNEDENVPNFMKETHHISSFQEPHQNKLGMVAPIETNELLQFGMSSDIKFGSPNDGSNNLDSHFNFLATSLDHESYVAVSTTPGWSDDFELHNPSNIQLHTSEELAPEDSRYSQTVSTILHNQLTRWSESNSSHQNSVYSTQSSFTTWTSKPQQYSRQRLPATSQRLLKYILFTVPFLHSNINGDASEESVLRKTTSHEELSVSHVMAERRRREKLNERFIILRTLVPLVTKMDKASILGDTIEYVKQLRKKIQDLEACCRSNKRKVRGCGGGAVAEVEVEVEVSIIENEALVEVQCAHREGLLLDVMKKLQELGVEITTVQSCVDAGLFSAEMRAKVKVRKGNNGKKISITQVKKAIDQIISP